MQLQALGEPIAVAVNSLTSLQRAHLTHLWARCLVEGGERSASGEDPVDVWASNGGLADSGVVPPVSVIDVSDGLTGPNRLSRAVTMAALKRRAGKDLLFHAAGLATDDGRVMVLVAPSGTGKTTAAIAMGRCLGYVSDESVSVRTDGSVAAFPKPLSLVSGDDPDLKRDVSPDDLGLRLPPAQLRLGRVVILQRDAEHRGDAVLEEVDLLESAVVVAAQTSGLRRLDQPLNRLLHCLSDEGPPVRLRYREIDECRDMLLDLATAAAPQMSARWTSRPDDRDLAREVADADREQESAWVRGRYVDAVEVDGRVLVLNQLGVQLLDGVGALAWLRTGHPASVSDVVAAASRAFGPHPDGERIVRDALVELHAHRLVRRIGGVRPTGATASS